MRLMDDCLARGYSIDLSTLINSPRGCTYSVFKNEVEYILRCPNIPRLPREDISPTLYKQKKEEFDAVFARFSELVKVSKQIGEGVIAPIDVFCSGRRLCYIVQSTRDLLSLNELKSMEISDRLFALKGFCSTLLKLHRLDLVHGNISYNTLRVAMTSSGKPVIKISEVLDFFHSQYPPPSALIIQSETYQSPEMVEYRNGDNAVSQQITCATDIFSAGILFHEILSGALPDYSGKENGRQLYQAINSDESYKLNEIIPVKMQHLIKKMLERNPDNRPTIQEIYEKISE